MSDRVFDDISDVLDQILGEHGSAMCVFKLGRVERYDAASRRADVQPIYKRVIEDDLGERAEADPVLASVPVVFMGVAGASILFTPARGDLVMLIFADHSLDRVDGTKLVDPLATRDPGAARSHHIADAIAIPIVLGKGAAAIEVKRDGTVHIGGDDRLVTKAEFDAHTHPAPGGATSAPTTPAAGTAKLRG